MGVRRRTPSVLTALHTALRAVPQADADAATVALAKRLALELDDAAVLNRSVKVTLRKVLASGIEPELYDQLLDLALRTEEINVAAVIGPKLLATLGELQLTPKSRSGILRGGGAKDDGPSQSALDELRARRKDRAKTLDTSS